eukprot:TRINITY_DN1218_c0_g1_i1.p1 TRINITY_DN1218_c0_g1~~TRINITY_DN1218_c0_g1_i1.p1  ORF type:complete len:155 (-),score=28.92 TRINITY_DN1218_c0_g1_i1:71-535(-)
MTTQRKVEIGPVQPIVTTIGDLYVHYFDHRYYVENEINHFIREFESKRGDHDANSLRDAHWLQVDSTQKIQEMTEQSEQLDNILTKAKQLNTTLQTQLSKEEQFKTSRKTKRDENSVKEEQAVQDLAKKQEETKHEIDNTLGIEKAQLEQEYKV